MKKKVIDPEHLKERVAKSQTGGWYDLYSMISLIDSEPPVDEEGSKKMGNLIAILVIIIAVLVFWVILNIMY